MWINMPIQRTITMIIQKFTLSNFYFKDNKSVYRILCKWIDEASKFSTLLFYLRKNFYTFQNDKEIP